MQPEPGPEPEPLRPLAGGELVEELFMDEVMCRKGKRGERPPMEREELERSMAASGAEDCDFWLPR